MYKSLACLSLVLWMASFAFGQNWIRGTWEGTGYQTDSQQTWTMKLSVTKKKFLIEYPSLACSGEWKRTSFNSQKATFRETIKVNKEACEPLGNVTIERLGKRQLMFIYRYKGSAEVTASAILNRKRK